MSTDTDNKVMKLEKLGEGSYFGEIALMVHMPRTATVVALERTLLLQLTKKNFHNFLHVVPDLKEKFNIIVKRRTAQHFKKFKVPFFAAIPPEQYAELAFLCKIEEFPSNTVIFAEGEMGVTFYIMVYGEVSISVNKPKQGTVLLCTMGPGQYFGEIALIKSVARTATVTTNTRCVILSITKENFRQFFAANPQARADFEVRLARYDVTLYSLINHNLGKQYFSQHLKTEYSYENMEFWDAANLYRNLKPTEFKVKSQELYDKFIKKGAPRQINLPAHILEELIMVMGKQQVDVSTFNRAQHEIYKLMSADSFKRFKLTPLFKKLLNQVDSYDNKSSKRIKLIIEEKASKDADTAK